MPNPYDATRRQRVLDYLGTLPPGSTRSVSSIIESLQEPGETADAPRWTSLLSALATEGLVEVSGGYRKWYALAPTVRPPTSTSGDDVDVASCDITATGSDTDPRRQAAEKLARYAAAAFNSSTSAEVASPDPMGALVAEATQQESEARGVPLDLLLGTRAQPDPDYLRSLSERSTATSDVGNVGDLDAGGAAEPPPHLPSGVAFDRERERFVMVETGYGPGPYFKDRWWSQRDAFPSWTENREVNERRQHDRLVDPEALEVFRAAVLIRAANTGWGIDAGLDADVREARALLAEARRQVREAALVGEHYTEQFGHKAY